MVAGKGPQEKALFEQSRGSRARVQVGFVSNEELIRLCQTSDLYIHASEAELEGMAALEAMRCGCPAVVSDARTSATQQFALGPNNLFPAGDVGALTARIDYWFEHRELLEGARRQTLDAVAEFSMSHTVESHLRLYQDLADHRLAPGKTPRRLAA